MGFIGENRLKLSAILEIRISGCLQSLFYITQRIHKKLNQQTLTRYSLILILNKNDLLS